MEIELWWLLALPLFFAAGWWAGRVEPSGRATVSRMPDAYFKGLNALLNDQPDQAVDAFIDVVRLEPDTVELHFALGSLFRRRGETDRAIRVHENLAQRTDLPADQRAHALFEVGLDTLKAGLMDRAEDAFNKLTGTPYEAAAHAHRLDIAQKVRDWPQAIALVQERLDRLPADSPPDPALQLLLAHFQCEQAAASQDESLRATFWDQAIEAAPQHPRARIAVGLDALARGDAMLAREQFEAVREHAPAHLNLVAKAWIQAHQELGMVDQGLAALEALAPTLKGAELEQAVIDARLQRDGGEATLAWLEASLKQRASLAGIDRLLGLQAQVQAERVEGDAQSHELVRSLLAPQLARQLRHTCGHCGFKAKRFYWQCPGCHRWDTTSPVLIEAP
jgi:lipopolysaccharide biosynthesis regulator YciM